MQTPLVSVIMPVFNGGRFVVDAIASIVEQSFTDWHMICINDGSTDQSGALLDWFAQREPRIEVHHQPNAGIVAALNHGIAAAKSPLICRMDCDDVALPQRLELQTSYMREHADCAVVGSAILEIDADNDPLQVNRLPSTHDRIVENLLHRRTGHFHPTTMIRAEALRAVQGYRSRFQWVEDHDLWLRLAERGELANLPEVLLCYRQHAGSVCWQRSELQRTLMNELLTEAYQKRSREVPLDVLAEGSMLRSAAGPGKWARAAAKGNFVRSALKHLLALNRSDCDVGYKARMNIEVGLRLLTGICTRPLASSQSPGPPCFSKWHARLAEEGLIPTPSRAAA